MKISRTLRAASLLALIGSASVYGASFQGASYEGFDYTDALIPDGTANLIGGGTGWNATGDAGQVNTTSWAVGTSLTASGTRFIAAGSLVSPVAGGAAPVGNSLQITGAGQIGRAIGQTVDSGTFYFSYLTQKTVDQVRSLNLSFFNGSSERLAFGQIANNLNTRDTEGVWQDGAGANSGSFVALVSNAVNSPVATVSDPTSFNGVYLAPVPQAYAFEQTFMIVGKIEFDAVGAAERISYYINPSNLADDSGLTPYLTMDHVDLGAITGFRVFAGGTSGGFTASGAKFDEIRFASTYAGVTGAAAIPEPSAFAALAGLVALGLASGRRRRA